MYNCREHTERLVSSDSDSDSDAGTSPADSSPDEPAVLLNLGDGPSTEPPPVQPVKQTSSSGTFFDLLNDTNQSQSTNQPSSDLSDLSAPYAPTTQPIGKGPEVDLLGGFESSVSQTNGLLQPNTGPPPKYVIAIYLKMYMFAVPLAHRAGELCI